MAPETPKGVSSRLLTMKFMQRAAASASSAGSPDSEAPSSKKRKLKGSPAESRINANIDRALIQAALDGEEATRQAALAKHSSADTHWVLSNTLDKAKAGKTTNRPLNIVYVGYGDMDSSDGSGDNEDAPAKGRTSTKSTSDQEHESADGDSDDQSSEESDEPKRKRKSRHSSEAADSPLAQDRSRSQSRSRHSAEGARAKEFRDKRKKKEVRLNQLVSISAGGNNSFDSPNAKGITCHSCHQAGHKASDCPKRRSGRAVRKS
ncbi:Uncharacterized protein TPAR_04958 [Tolypocladium paradoxum]|uniref:CCHC-type domain-containing protein n=1 Tax=Tolypocladium paradoxum TaxID=94208 RepID=A0A2S4KXC6_9HYPO|nr:Uncharacterized protein TPAR_04958 [Tolypocladium paradoxum]